jgi:DUF1365 family protein
VVSAVGPSLAGGALAPGRAAICSGTVFHRRTRPAVHSFTHPVSMVWIDPDRPGDLFGAHPLWSARRPAPVRYRRGDYGLPGTTEALSSAVRRAIARSLGREPTGEVRMLTQPRTCGWLFNPITLYLAWDDGTGRVAGPVGVVAEVTNTPWKERHWYPVALSPGMPATATFAKELHVSPFLGPDLRYAVAIHGGASRIEVAIDVIELDQPAHEPVLRTALALERAVPTRRALTRAMLGRPLPTHRVSARIHREAARLWRRGVPVVPHPDRNRASTPVDRTRGEQICDAC